MADNEDDPFLLNPPDASSEDAESVLFQKLHETSRLLDHSENFGRDAAIAALGAVGKFLNVRGANGRMTRPLQLLIEALTELGTETSDGRIYVPEMLDPHPLDEDGKPKSKRSRSHKKKEIIRYSSACVAVLVNKGSSPDDAAAKVAHAIEKWPVVDSQEITSSTVHSWWREYKEAMESDSARQGVEYVVNEMLKKGTGDIYLDHTLKKGPPRLGGLSSGKRSLPPG